jgi:hypothetical protein
MAIQKDYTDPQTGMTAVGAYHRLSFMRAASETIVGNDGKASVTAQQTAVLDIYRDKAMREQTVTVPNAHKSAAAAIENPDMPDTVEIAGAKRLTRHAVQLSADAWATIMDAKEGDARRTAAYKAILALPEYQGASSV